MAPRADELLSSEEPTPTRPWKTGPAQQGHEESQNFTLRTYRRVRATTDSRSFDRGSTQDAGTQQEPVLLTVSQLFGQGKLMATQCEGVDITLQAGRRYSCAQGFSNFDGVALTQSAVPDRIHRH